jgi:hypothetical protein
MYLDPIVGHTLEVLGTLMIAFAALRVHHRVLHEHRIDKKVFKAMKKERVIGVIGVGLVVLGYVAQLFSILA